MAMDDNGRVFKLVVSAVEVRMLNDERCEAHGIMWGDGDAVEIEYVGKVLPSTQKRIAGAFKTQGILIQSERRLA
jgi:hypothetical protein